MRKRHLARRLADVRGFEEPRVELEQYPTPADLAAHLVHAAAIRGDVAGRTVLDLGCGTGVLALGAALTGADRVVGLDRDRSALAVARENERRVGVDRSVDWLLGDARRAPLRPAAPATALLNPPFGAQRGRESADRAFLATVAGVATVSYSIHNGGSREFVEAFAGDEGGTVTDAWEATLALDRQFPFHENERREIPVEVFRIEWGGYS